MSSVRHQLVCSRHFVRYKGILIIFGIYNRCQWMKVRIMCRKFDCCEDIHYKTQTGTSCKKCNSKAFRLGIEPASSSGQLHFSQLVPVWVLKCICSRHSNFLSTHNFVRHHCIKLEIICLPLYWPVAMPSCHFHSVHYNVLILEAIHLWNRMDTVHITCNPLALQPINKIKLSCSYQKARGMEPGKK